MAERAMEGEEEPRYINRPKRTSQVKVAHGPTAAAVPKRNHQSSNSTRLPPVPPRPYSGTMLHSPSTSQAFELPPQLPHRSKKPVSSMKWVEQVKEEKAVQQQKLTLSELAENHSQAFPLRVKVTKGFSTPQAEIPAGDVYNIHFLKKTNVVTIKDSCQNGYTIPFNSAAKFGIVYGHGGHGNTPAVFDTAEDIMAAELLPRVVCATRSYKGHKPKSSVDAGEVLTVQGVRKPQSESSKSLLVFSITKMQQKKLKKECAGCFTTDPQQTRMYIPELLENIQNRLPLVARLFLDFGGDEQIPDYLTEKPVTLTTQYTEASLIATSGAERSEDDDMDAAATPTVDRMVPREIISIPVDLRITVGIVTPSAAADTEELYSNTRAIYENYNPAKTKLLTDAQEEGIYSAWSQLHARVRQGHQNEGLSLQMPVMAYQPLMADTRQRKNSAAYSTVGFRTTEVADSSSFDSQKVSRMYHELDCTTPDPEYSYIEVSNFKMARQQGPPLYAEIDSLKARADRLQAGQRTEQARIERIESQLLQASASLSSTNMSIEDDIAKVKEGIARISRLSGSSDLQPHSHSNRRMLIGMTEEQVQALLLVFGMSQYQESFSREFIDGEVLSECDEETLELELGVSDPEHRAKLMAVIRGEHSLRGSLEGERPYVALDTKSILSM